MKKTNITTLLLLGIIAAVGHSSLTTATSGPAMRECWHGIVNNPFRDFLGVVPASQACPTYQHPTILYASEEEHIEGDPNCQTSELNPFE